MRRVISVLCLFFFASAPLFAQTYDQVGKWVFYEKENISMAFVAGQSQSSTGVICFKDTKKCSPFLETIHPCTPSARPINLLAASSVGSYHIAGTCVILPQNRTVLRLEKEEDMYSIFESGGGFAFSIPVEGNRFAEYSFETSGASVAIRKVVDSVKNQSNAKSY